MANYTSNHAKSATLGVSTVDIVTLAQDVASVDVTNRDGTNFIWVRVDGVSPTVAGDDCYAVAPNRTLRMNTLGSTTEIRLISSAASPYTVADTQ